MRTGKVFAREICRVHLHFFLASVFRLWRWCCMLRTVVSPPFSAIKMYMPICYPEYRRRLSHVLTPTNVTSKCFIIHAQTLHEAQILWSIFFNTKKSDGTYQIILKANRIFTNGTANGHLGQDDWPLWDYGTSWDIPNKWRVPVPEWNTRCKQNTWCNVVHGAWIVSFGANAIIQKGLLGMHISGELPF